MKKNLAIIIVNFNGAKDTIECVRSIEKNCKLENLEIIIVDNASSENDKKLLLDNLKENKVILNDRNMGFAVANNIGIEYAINRNFENILLLNNDTLITKCSLEDMLRVLNENKEIGAVSCSILYNSERDKIWFDGGNINWKTYLSTHDNMKKIFKKTNDIVDVGFISGCCLMVKKEVIDKIGMLPTEYFMYFEDTDFSAKIIDSGYKMKIVKKAVIYHKVSASSGGEESPFSIQWCNRNRLIFMKKYRNKSKNNFRYVTSNIYFFITRFVRFFQYIFKGDIRKAKSIIIGISEGIRYK